MRPPCSTSNDTSDGCKEGLPCKSLDLLHSFQYLESNLEIMTWKMHLENGINAGVHCEAKPGGIEFAIRVFVGLDAVLGVLAMSQTTGAASLGCQ